MISRNRLIEVLIGVMISIILTRMLEVLSARRLIRILTNMYRLINA